MNIIIISNEHDNNNDTNASTNNDIYKHINNIDKPRNHPGSMRCVSLFQRERGMVFVLFCDGDILYFKEE